MNNETTPTAGTCTGEPPCSPLRSFFHGLAAVSANVIKATQEEVKQLHDVADKCADEHEANRAVDRNRRSEEGVSDE